MTDEMKFDPTDKVCLLIEREALLKRIDALEAENKALNYSLTCATETLAEFVTDQTPEWIENELLREKVEKLEAELAALKAWHPASEPPKTSGLYIVYYLDAFGCERFTTIAQPSGFSQDVTFWRELPAPPEETWKS